MPRRNKSQKETQNTFYRPKHSQDKGQAHIQFGEDPKPLLQEFGYCVIENVFTKEECYRKIDEIWDWLEGLNTGIDRKKSNTWTKEKWPIYVKRGMLQHTIAHEELMWTVREHPNVLAVYEQIFNTNELLTSFDGAKFEIPPPKHKSFKVSEMSWLHTDQRPIPEHVSVEDTYNSDYYSIQGVANFADVGDLDGSLFVGERSHLYHHELFKLNNHEPSGDWYLITKNDLNWLQKVKKVNFVKVNALKGSLILFDSRCIHSGYPAQKNRKDNKFRYVIYIALTPAYRATGRDYALKMQSIKEGRCSTHWSSNNVTLFKPPRVYGKRPKYLDRPENIKNFRNWSRKRKLLAGILRY